MPTRAPDRASSPLPPVAEATRAATICLAATALGLAVSYAVVPSQRAWLAADNGLTDHATAVLLALAALIAWWAIRRTRGNGGWRYLLLVGALLGFLDEVHYGVGLFGFGVPQVGPVAVDGISGLFEAGRHLAETRLGLSALDLAAGAVVVTAAGAFLLARHRRAARVAAWLGDRPPVVHLLAATFLVILAVALDLFAGPRLVRFTEEWLEFAGAALLLRGALLISRREPEAAGWRQRLQPWLDGGPSRRAAPSAPPWKPGS